jgi:hypothetical protein
MNALSLFLLMKFGPKVQLTIKNEQKICGNVDNI